MNNTIVLMDLIEHESTCAVQARRDCDCDRTERAERIADLLASAWDRGYGEGLHGRVMTPFAANQANPFRDQS